MYLLQANRNFPFQILDGCVTLKQMAELDEQDEQLDFPIAY